jgi:predicted phosphodiesterase
MWYIFSKSKLLGVFLVLSVVLVACNNKNNKHSHDHGHSHAHEGLRHWEIPSKDPDRIILTFNGNPATSRAVTWRTDSTVTKAVAQIALATNNSDFKDEAKTVQAKTEAFDLGLYKSNATLKVHYHSVNLDGLEPDQLYAYRVGDGEDIWSEWIQFRTAKAEYAPTTFVYFGDAQNDVLSHWSRVIRMAYQTAPEASFVIHAGDLINSAHKDQEWAEWYKAGGFIHSQWTAIPVVGNHEFRPTAKDESRKLAIQWRPQFTLPVESSLPEKLHETVYTVDYQGIRIITLNSNTDLEAQTAYLEDKLKTSTAKWNIITCHHSIFSPAKGRDFEFARTTWKPLLDQYNVDLVLNGHDHTYARGHAPMRTTSSAKDTEITTVYVTSVSGPKLYKLDKEQIKRYEEDGYTPDKTAEQTQFYQVITIEDNALTYVAYTATGEEYDRAVIVKDFESGKKQLKQEVSD